uniref:Phosphoribulokinase/uridine kinase domain-containing protein n=1 Tax=Graphocephala atropunctata TaxID=36148 RepID=A0A1B6LX11_9HEMI
MTGWLVVGVSGVTCGGKTTFATALHQAYPSSTIVHQDHYFLSPDDPRHILVPELGHLNWEIPSSLDMESMYKHVDNILSRPAPVGNVPLLIIEGFLILSDPHLSSLCHHKLLFTLTRDECQARRSTRVYDPPDVPGYFSDVVWPEYERQLQLALALNPDMTLVSGTTDVQELLQHLKLTLDSRLSTLKYRVSDNK